MKLGTWAMRLVLSACAFSCAARKADPLPVTSVESREPSALASEIEASELTPVAAPPELFAVARLRALPGAVDMLIDWMGLPVNWRQQLGRTAPGTLEALDQNGAIEFAAILDPESLQEPRVLFAVSLPLRSRDAALALAEQRGWPVKRLSAGRDEVDAGEPCFIAASVGPSRARWVCSNHREALQALEPYMTRGLPTEALPMKTFYGRLSVEPFRRRYADKAAVVRSVGVPFLLKELGLDNATFDDALAEAARSLGDEIVGLLKTDLSGLTLSAELDSANNRLDLQAELAFEASETWSGRALRDAASRQEAAPELLFRLPEEFTGSYSGSRNPELTREMFGTLSRLSEGLLEYGGASKALAHAFATAAAGLNDVTGPFVFASSAPVSDRSLGAVLGYERLVMMLDGDKRDGVASLFGELAKVLADERFAKSLAKKVDEFKGLPAVVKSNVRVDELKAVLYQFKLSKEQSAALGSKVEAETEQEPLTIGVLVVDEGDKSWVSVGNEPEKLALAVSAVRKQSALRPGLELLRQPSSGGGFTTVQALTPTVLHQMREHDQGKLPSPQTLLSSLPHGGRTPIITRIVVSTSEPKSSVHINVPRDAVQDLAAAVLAVLAAK